VKKYSSLILSLIPIAYFWNYAATYTSWHFIDYVNLIFHEAGHAIFSFFGTFIHLAAGSAFQVLLPLFLAGYFFYKKQHISGSIVLLWVGQNLLNVSVYARDAIAMNLDLLGGDAVTHDWNALLTMTGLLKHTQMIANTFYGLGIGVIFVGTVLTLYYTTKGKDPHSI
jgi:hypothetical protein